VREKEKERGRELEGESESESEREREREREREDLLYGGNGSHPAKEVKNTILIPVKLIYTLHNLSRWKKRGGLRRGRGHYWQCSADARFSQLFGIP
jgi:hypothetical protein